MATKTPDQIKRELEARVAALKAAPIEPEIAAFVNLRETVANHVFEAMQAQDISKAELARRLGTSRAYVSKLLGGGANVSLETLAQIAQVLGLEVSVRLEPKEPKPSEARTREDGWGSKAFERPPLKQITGGSARHDWQRSAARLSLVDFEGGASGTSGATSARAGANREVIAA